MPDKEMCACCGKTTKRSEEERKKLIHRLNRIEGQIRGIRGMLEKDAYCADILTQSAAVNAAVNAFNKELLASHIRGCVARDIREGKDETIDELVATCCDIAEAYEIKEGVIKNNGAIHCYRHELRRLLGESRKGGVGR